MKLKTRIFELYKGKYRGLPELARAMEISYDTVYRVKRGERGIHERFIIGALKAFPEYKLDYLFYVEGRPVNSSNNLPEFREYARLKYSKELDEDLITMIEDLIERGRRKT